MMKSSPYGGLLQWESGLTNNVSKFQTIAVGVAWPSSELPQDGKHACFAPHERKANARTLILHRQPFKFHRPCF